MKPFYPHIKRPIGRLPVKKWRLQVGGYMFAEESEDQLLEKASRYLAATGGSTEDLQQRIEAQFCEDHPYLCRWAPKANDKA